MSSQADPDNKLLAVFPRLRLEAEEIRDSLLAAAGRLDDTVGGPSVFPPVPKGLNAGNLWQVSKDPERPQSAQPLYLHPAERGLSDAGSLQHGVPAAGPQPARR